MQFIISFYFLAFGHRQVSLAALGFLVSTKKYIYINDCAIGTTHDLAKCSNAAMRVCIYVHSPSPVSFDWI